MSTSDTPPDRGFEPTGLVGAALDDRYRVVRLLGEGANTVIYDADDERTGRSVTLKLVQPRLAASPAFRERFDDTMRQVAALSHPNIAAVYDWGIARVGDTSSAFVVIEQLGGGSLRDLFDRGRRLSPSQALAVGLDTCRGLDYAHRRGLVHTELTPSKLVFGDDRRLRIIDFGLARLLGEPGWQQPDSVPTHVAWYAAPEQGLAQPVDGRTDVYALALTLHEAVTGTVPFRNDSTVASLSARVGRLMPVSADLGPLASVLERAGRPDRDDRATAAQFGKSLVQAASKLPRPEPLPLLSSGLFDTPADQLRSPDDPTGGVTRPGAGATAPVVVVPVDEPAPGEADHPAHDPSHVPGDDPGDDPGARPAAESAPIDDDVPDAAVSAAAAAATGSAAARVAAPAGARSDASSPSGDGPTGDAPESPVIVEAEPDAEIPRADPGDDLVILPLDSGIAADAPKASGAPTQPTPSTPTASAPSEPAATAEWPSTTTRVMPVAAPPDPPPARRRFPWKILLALLVVAALVVLGVLATRLFRTPVYTVPDLAGLPEAEARNLVAPNGWEVSVERERSDVTPVVGEVVRTVPRAEVDLAEGEPFLIVVSEGPTLRELPDSTGVPVSEAQTRLVERGLVPETVQEFDEVVPEGVVISWSVPGDPTLGAGSMVEPETVVELVVSEGPAPRTVPDVVGLTAGEARRAVEDLQLVFTRAGEEFSDDVPLGEVISQGTEPGTEVERGSEVTVIVSLGPDLVTFPDISAAADYEEAAQIVTEAGFEPVLTFGDAQGQIRSYTIDGEQPDVGATYRRGTVVEFQALDPA